MAALVRSLIATLATLPALAGWALWGAVSNPAIYGFELSMSQRLLLVPLALLCFIPWGILSAVAEQRRPGTLHRIRWSRRLRRILTGLGLLALFLAEVIEADPQEFTSANLRRLYLGALAIYGVGVSTLLWDLGATMAALAAPASEEPLGEDRLPTARRG